MPNPNEQTPLSPDSEYREKLRNLILKRIEEDGKIEEYKNLTETLVNFHFCASYLAHFRGMKGRLEKEKEELENLRRERKNTLITDEEYENVIENIEDTETQIRTYESQIDTYRDHLEKLIGEISLGNKILEEELWEFSESIIRDANKIVEKVFRGK